METLLERIEGEADTYVFLGDYIDRGPNSKEVIDCVLDFKAQQKRVITLLGNHEFMLLNYLAGHDDDIYLQAGGVETLTSYGIDPDDDFEKVRLQFPDSHFDFLNQLLLTWEDRHAYYVHAGLQPKVPLCNQHRDCCLWIREPFIRSSYKFEKQVVFGHTTFKKPLVQKNKIGIDTGAVYGRTLTALLLPEREFISVPGEKEHPYPLP